MFARKIRNSTFVFLLLCLLSAGSYGFLVGKSYHFSASPQTEVQAVVGQLQTTGGAVARGLRAVKFLLIK